MDPIIESVKDMLDANAPLSAIVQHLGGRDGFTLTPFNLIRVLHQASGISVSTCKRSLRRSTRGYSPLNRGQTSTEPAKPCSNATAVEAGAAVPVRPRRWRE